MDDANSKIKQIKQHIFNLAETIGPRASTQPAELQAAQYAYEQLQRMGYLPHMESFLSARSIYHPHMLASLLMLVAFIVYPMAGRLSATIAAGLSIFALFSDLLELGFIPNPLRLFIPKGRSQNAFATLEPKGAHQRDVILVGHLDTHQAGKIFSSQGWVTFFQIFTLLAFAAFSAQVGFFLVGVLAQWAWLWYASIPSALSAMLLFGLCWEADRAPYSPGANDNASAVAMVLALAEMYKTSPLENIRLWFVLTGCEEVQHYGMKDFLKRHQAEFVDPRVLVFEMVGVAGPAWEAKEGILIPFRPDKNLVRIAEGIAQEHPDLGAYPSSIVGGNTEMADARRMGIPAITFFGLTPEGRAPYWHQMADTCDKIDPDVLSRTLRFTRLFIEGIDRSL
jgi:hypothetical protein